MTTYSSSASSYSMAPMLAFARAQLTGQIRNWRSTAPALFTPMLLLVLFTLTGDEDAPSLVPFVVGFAVMFSGQTLAQVLITWRNNKVFTRFAATPTPTSHLLLATVFTQMIMFVLQSILVMIVGLLLNDLRLDVQTIPLIVISLTVGCMTFLSFGAMIAAFVSKVETASIVYTFILLPMIFLGGSVFTIPGLGDFGRFLPPTLITELLNPYFGFGEIQIGQTVVNLALLLIYVVAFTAIAARFFKTDD